MAVTANVIGSDSQLIVIGSGSQLIVKEVY